MTKAHEIRELIAEQASGPGERRALESVADRLEVSLTHEVPHRPEFRAELRRQLMAEARRTLNPWYRRPAFWGTGLGVAAAAAVLAVGMSLMQTADPTKPGPVAGVTDKTPASPGVTPNERLVAKKTLPVVSLADEELPFGAQPESLAGLDWQEGLKAYTLTVRVDENLFNRIAGGMGITVLPAKAGGDLLATQEARSLRLSEDGRVEFTDGNPAAGAQAPTVYSSGAIEVARRFLERSALPVPSSDPVVTEGQADGGFIYTVTFTPRVEGRPVVNGRTLIQVNARGGVVRAEAYAHAPEEAEGPYEVIAPAEAITRAQQIGGGSFTQADLVYVRTRQDFTTWLQPYWRVFGKNAQGVGIARYVPALVPEK